MPTTTLSYLVFNSSLLPTLATILAGLVAYLVYRKQKIDNKRDAAKLILQEIRYAEQQIRNHKIDNGKYQLADKILPTNSWNENIHYFIKELKEPEIDLISRFYSNSQYLDTLIDKISNIKSEWWNIGGVTVPSQFLNSTQPQSSIISSPTVNFNNTPTPLPSINNSSVELHASVILREVSSKIELIYNTPAVQKLANISEKKVVWLF